MLSWPYHRHFGAVIKTRRLTAAQTRGDDSVAPFSPPSSYRLYVMTKPEKLLINGMRHRRAVVPGGYSRKAAKAAWKGIKWATPWSRRAMVAVVANDFLILRWHCMQPRRVKWRLAASNGRADGKSSI